MVYMMKAYAHKWTVYQCGNGRVFKENFAISFVSGVTNCSLQL